MVALSALAVHLNMQGSGVGINIYGGANVFGVEAILIDVHLTEHTLQATFNQR